jgi:hypothetical protein
MFMVIFSPGWMSPAAVNVIPVVDARLVEGSSTRSLLWTKFMRTAGELEIDVAGISVAAANVSATVRSGMSVGCNVAGAMSPHAAANVIVIGVFSVTEWLAL